MKKIFCIILISLVGLYTIFILEECIRLNLNQNSKPLLIMDRTKYCVSCIQPGEEIEVEYLSLGYKLKVRYYLSEKSSDDNKIIQINGEEFLLFNKFRLWAWIS